MKKPTIEDGLLYMWMGLFSLFFTIMFVAVYTTHKPTPIFLFITTVFLGISGICSFLYGLYWIFNGE